MKLPLSDKFMKTVKKLAMNVLAEVLEELAVQVRALASAEPSQEDKQEVETKDDNIESVFV